MMANLPACCARAASGHATAPPRSVMNSRRFTAQCPVRPTEKIAHLVRQETAALRDFSPGYDC